MLGRLWDAIFGEPEPIPDRPPLLKLTIEQGARLTPFTEQWIETARSTMPLTDDEWRTWEAGMQAGYAAAGRRWPGVVVRVGSPVVGALAASVAVQVLGQLRRDGVVYAAAIDARIRELTEHGVDAELRPAVTAAATEAVRGALAQSAATSSPPTDCPDWVQFPRSDLVAAMCDVGARSIYHKAFKRVWLPVQYAVDFPIFNPLTTAIGDAVPDGWSYEQSYRMHCESAFAAFVRDEAKVPLDEALLRYSEARQNMLLTPLWWTAHYFVMVCDRPTELHLDEYDGAGRLHNASGPAVRWADGRGLYFWHGTPVPAELIGADWDVARILAEPNLELRRSAIERLGWDRFVADAGFRLVHEAPDPANAGQRLRLYDVPRDAVGTRLRVLLCSNATRERDGTRRSFGILVPTDCRTALAAAAWTFDVPVAAYAGLARAT